ncbi:MAG: PaaI family thioesterase [Lentisphaerae bacterium]|nr:PaaI family thioesterase [Lentisphaerota bacterium]
MSLSIDPALRGILPWTRACFVCGQDNVRGLRLKSRVQDGVIFLEYTTRPADLGYRHIVHGGISMTLLDEVMTWAAILACRRACVAAEMTARLKQPLVVGQTLRVEGRISGGRARLALTDGEIRDAGGRILVTATGKYVPMSRTDAALSAEDFVAGPGALDPAVLLASTPGPR